MTLRDVLAPLERFAPPAYQEGYDNSGLQVGDPGMAVTGILTTLDVTDAVLDEALARGCNVVIAHHPVIFKGLKRLTGRTAPERLVIRALREGLALYACHTNLDNVRGGVNAGLAEKLGLRDTTVLVPRTDTLSKLQTYVPETAAAAVRDALFAAGAGAIGAYTECSYNLQGTGTFRPGPDADPAIGQAGGPREQVNEVKIEVVLPTYLEGAVHRALVQAHPYESVAYEFIRLANANPDVGAGMVGTLPQPLDTEAFLRHLQERLGLAFIRHTPAPARAIHRVAVCGGSGSFLLEDAVRAGADALVTGDFKYHQFLDADGRLLVADIGHGESERHTAELLARVLREKLPNFAVHISETNTNPVSYFH